MGALPANLTVLTAVATNGLGQTAGPFLASVPVPPFGGNPVWSAAYAYAPDTPSAGMFTISATGDGTTVSVP
jgi:hypothetical protein